MYTFAYPARIDQDGKRFLVTFPDFADAATDGATLDEAVTEASDVLATALIERIERGEAIPAPSAIGKDHTRIAPDATTAAKAALYLAVKDAKVSGRSLGRDLGIDPKEARRLLDPRQATKMPRLEEALAALGHEGELTVRPRLAAKATAKPVATKVRKASALTAKRKGQSAHPRRPSAMARRDALTRG